MQIQLNNEQRSIEQGTSIGQLVDQLDLKRKFVAVELNRELVPREQLDARLLSDGDELEIVTLVGGG